MDLREAVVGRSVIIPRSRPSAQSSTVKRYRCMDLHQEGRFLMCGAYHGADLIDTEIAKSYTSDFRQYRDSNYVSFVT
ncbi:unnamed protein product [Dracunculus medinensis]|uniref:Uncharacterized protein n=1 Tax=Dracunculus medinensis TaxID=318479 RepID=A0A0N4UJJ0_DRAME|nr:unnamed protein product [Dracunculus medinensis]